MNDDFKYQCRRRSARQHPAIEEAIVKVEQLLGAGSGGDAGDGDNVKIFDGWLNVGCSGILMSAVGDTGPQAESPIIQLVSGGGQSLDGRVYTHGSQGVRITSGPPGQPKMGNKAINGVEVQVGETQEIHIKRGVLPTDNDIQLIPGLIVVDGAAGKVVINSDTLIKLTVANGTSSITLTPMGIVMQGPVITLN